MDFDPSSSEELWWARQITMPLAGAPTRLTGAFLVLLQLATVRSEDAKCSIQTCPQVDPQYYTVHIVPHSHMDLGWLKTGWPIFSEENRLKNIT